MYAIKLNLIPTILVTENCYLKIRCHDFRVDFCTRAYDAKIPIKTLQAWMGHSDASMIMNIYAKLTEEKETIDAELLNAFASKEFSS